MHDLDELECENWEELQKFLEKNFIISFLRIFNYIIMHNQGF